MEDPVIVRNSETEWTVRSCVLCNCSEVLEKFLRDGAGTQEGKVLTMRDSTTNEVDCFLWLASSLSYDCDQEVQCTTQWVAEKTPEIMPLVHKYDARGLLKVVHHAVNEHPVMDAILSILKHDECCSWMKQGTLKYCIENACQVSAKHRFASNLRSEKEKSIHSFLDSLPNTLVKRLFVVAYLDETPKLCNFV